MSKIELEHVVDELRKALWSAIKKAGDDELAFQVGDIEVEFSVAVTNEAGANAGVKFWVIELGGSASHAQAETQKIKFSLTPMYRKDPAKAVLTAAPWPPADDQDDMAQPPAED
jgi:hypothetical protein